MNITNVAKLLMYKGPSPKDIIMMAIRNNYDVNIESKGDSTVVSVESTAAYDVKLKDIYVYNIENELIKQLLIINDKEKVIFDKYMEATLMIDEIQRVKRIAC